MPELWSNPVAVRNCAASVAPETSRSDQRLLRAGARSDYLPALDGLRCLAFLGVLLNHVRVPDGLPLMHIASERGSIGVELFFVLSSYLLFSLFRVEFEETGRISVSNFFVRRLLRLYPLMVAAPLVFIVVAYPNVDLTTVVARWLGLALFVDNFVIWIAGWNSIPLAAPLWTLSFEFQVYAVLPLAFIAYRRFGTRRFVLLLGALSLAGLCLRGVFVMVKAPHPVIWVTPFLRPDSILLGMMIALVRPRAGQGAAMAAVTLVAAAALFLALPPTRSIGPNTLITYPVVTLICGSALWLMLTDAPGAKLLANRVFVYLGRRSFGLYVFHSLGIYFAERILGSWTNFGEDSFLRYFIVLALALGIATTFAALSYRFFERPFLELKARKGGLASMPS